MYGLVLMTALATGSGSPSYGDGVVVGGGCYGSCCGGVVISGCYGSSCTGCTGCTGGGFFARRRARVENRVAFRQSLRGHYASSCFGTTVYYGSDFHGGCTGCFGSAPVFGHAMGEYDAVPYVSIPSVSVEYQATVAKPNAAPARLTIDVPEGAKLYVDGQLTNGTGANRNFHTPNLPKDQTFFYDLKAEVMIDGEVVVETKRVLVRSGEVLTESFPKLIAAVKNANDPKFVTKR